jgi:citrate lyase subunit beta/citryl-CoA lyase
MPAAIHECSLYLFVPANRPERFAKAASSAADAVIIDLEDAVAVGDKMAAREGLASAIAGIGTSVPLFIRINGIDTLWHAADIAVATDAGVAGIVVPKAESAADLGSVRMQLAEDALVIAIIESARGLAAADEIAANADRIAFGSVDFAADLGCAHMRDALLLARSRIVLAARIAGKPAPIDGVTLSIGNEDEIEGDARYGATLGFGGKLLIHPGQIAPARRGMAPSEQEAAWASRIIESAADGAAKAVDGAMVDAPVLARARQILRARDRLLNG